MRKSPVVEFGFLAFMSTLFLNVFAASISFPQVKTYFRTTTFVAVRISQSDLLAILAKVRAIIKSANIDHPSGRPRTILRLGTEEVSLEIGEDFSPENLRLVPPVSYVVEFRYVTDEEAPISTVWINLTEWLRQIRVEGKRPEQVDTLIALFEKELRPHTTFFGGFKFRSLITTVFWVLGAFLVFAPLPDDLGVYKTSMRLGGLGFIIVGGLPGSLGWFPGTTVYASDASFVIRNAPLFSFLGLLIAPILFVLQIVVERLQRRRNRHETAEG